MIRWIGYKKCSPNGWGNKHINIWKMVMFSPSHKTKDCIPGVWTDGALLFKGKKWMTRTEVVYNIRVFKGYSLVCYRKKYLQLEGRRRKDTSSKSFQHLSELFKKHSSVTASFNCSTYHGFLEILQYWKVTKKTNNVDLCSMYYTMCCWWDYHRTRPDWQ